MSFGDWLSGLGLVAGTYADYKNLELQRRPLTGKRRRRRRPGNGRTMRLREELQTLKLLVLIPFWLLVLPLSLVLQYVFRPRNYR